ncbi:MULTISPECIES: hypothetical protein [Roseateles]|uniref:Uncharacterized protein n=1 Tax=Roseateles albus TaxID=2987525 RepID=A0ABT5KHI7_9BURK|nr:MULTISPECIES: hypothetical protein [Roseateles]MCV2360560.1 hypothetical protein [Paucibacter sp. TC2R-5]MDC8773409.1 hypothetical protein [Roseateles albus]
MSYKHAAGTWSTSSFGDSADTSPGELQAMGEHLGLCRANSGAVFRLRCAAESLHGFVAPRFITSLILALLLLMVGSVLLG